ncbi:MAG TPA: alpha-hydroxy acid oxidase [Steroidobacteraceae bacterium]|nr:alpha-hydroxy acid oxidase [Steroidobacteraceae bacterium]
MSFSATEGSMSRAAAAAHIAVRPRRSRSDLLCLEDFAVRARRRLPRMLYGFVAGGAESGASLRNNRASFERCTLVPRVLIDTRARTQATALFGRTYAAPFGIAPLGAAALCAYRADIELARAAASADIPMILSASSLIPLEQVRQAGALWYQAYLPGDAARIEALVARVAAAGFETLVLTADVPVAANRENNLRNGFSLPVVPGPRLCWQALTHPRWLFGTALRTLLRHGMPRFENMDAGRGAPILSRNLVRELGQRDGLTWEHLRLMRRLWPGKLVVKGILSPADAQLARDCGADGIIVSNHGGRQLDGAASPMEVLPAIAAHKAGLTVMLDGAIRRGTDVLKALALGADFVFLGRPFLYAATLGGAPMVAEAARLLCEEIHRDMALLGINRLAELGPQHVLRGP